MTDESVLVVERFGRVLVLRLNRPQVLNALSPALVEALTSAARAADADESVGCLVLAGAGRSFCAGGDLTAMLRMNGDLGMFRAYIVGLQVLSRTMRELGIPTIAALHGHVLAGGFELAIECDLRIAARGTVFGLPDTALGLSPTSGMSWLLPRIVGESWARQLLLTGETIDATTAERIGLLTRVVEGGDVEQAAIAIAAGIAAHPPLSVRRIREELAAAAQGTFEDALAREIEAELECFETPAFQANLRAFADRRRR
jgi:enoyl-CoA hydratase/carnithine racemase